MNVLKARNVGRLDQILRIGISIGLIYIGFIDRNLVGDSFSATVLGVVGVMNLMVALLRICPLYSMVGIDTCHTSHRE